MVSADSVVEIVRKKLLGYKGITGIYPDGDVIVVCSTKGLPAGFPKNIAGYDIVVEPIPEMFPQQAPQTGRYRPILGGISCAVSYQTAGTLGGIFKDADTGAPVLVSNAHVIANANQVVTHAVVGDKIIQPGRYDGGSTDTDVIGHLLKWSELKTNGNYIDCAKGSVDVDFVPAVLWGNTTKEIKGFRDAATLKKGEKVYKSGRTTGTTSGTVVTTSYSCRLRYGPSTKEFINQILIRGDDGPFSMGGDSGSIVMDKDGYAVGLLFAGSNNYSLANPMKYVVRYLDLDLMEYDKAGVPVKKEPKGYINAIPLILLGTTLYMLR